MPGEQLMDVLARWRVFRGGHDESGHREAADSPLLLNRFSMAISVATSSEEERRGVTPIEAPPVEFTPLALEWAAARSPPPLARRYGKHHT